MTDSCMADAIICQSNEISAEMAALSDQIWEHPETAFEEHFAASLLSSWLRDKDFIIQPNLGGLATAFTASSGSGSPVIAILGEFDALPNLSQKSGTNEEAELVPGGAGHGCGHNLLGAGAAGAAVILRDQMKRLGLPGTVRYYGCPAEESGAGKEILCNAGVFRDVDFCITWHPDRANKVVGESCLANLIATADFHGIASHAATAAYRGRSALDACELMNVGANYLREHVPPDVRFHYAYTNSGNPLPNVVSEHAGLVYYIRASKTTEAMEVLRRIEKIAQGAALMTETELSFHHTSTLNEYRPNRVLAGVCQEAFEEIGCPCFTPEEFKTASLFYPGEGPSLNTDLRPLVTEDICLSFSTDVGNVSQLVPTVQLYTVCAAKWTPFHTRKLVAQTNLPAAKRGMTTAAGIMALTALKVLQTPSLLAEAKKEHNNHI